MKKSFLALAISTLALGGLVACGDSNTVSNVKVTFDFVTAATKDEHVYLGVVEGEKEESAEVVEMTTEDYVTYSYTFEKRNIGNYTYSVCISKNSIEQIEEDVYVPVTEQKSFTVTKDLTTPIPLFSGKILPRNTIDAAKEVADASASPAVEIWGKVISKYESAYNGVFIQQGDSATQIYGIADDAAATIKEGDYLHVTGGASAYNGIAEIAKVKAAKSATGEDIALNVEVVENLELSVEEYVVNARGILGLTTDEGDTLAHDAWRKVEITLTIDENPMYGTTYTPKATKKVTQNIYGTASVKGESQKIGLFYSNSKMTSEEYFNTLAALEVGGTYTITGLWNAYKGAVSIEAPIVNK